jgi:hypothetical protein
LGALFAQSRIFPGGLVVAAHEEYLAMEGYRQAARFLETTVRSADLTDDPARQFAKSSNIGWRCTIWPNQISNVVDEDVLDLVARDYLEGAGRNLRRVLLLLHSSLVHAAADQAKRITAKYLEAARAEWLAADPG